MWSTPGTVTRAACWLVISFVVACGQARETTPEEQQLARMNRELATLQQSVAALQERMDRVDGRAVGASPSAAVPAKPSVAGTDVGAAGSGPGLDAPGHDLDVDEHTLVVEVGKRTYIIDGKSVSDADLSAALAAHKSSTSAPRLLLQAGPDVAYERVVAAIDLARAAGIDRFALARTGSPDAEIAQP